MKEVFGVQDLALLFSFALFMSDAGFGKTTTTLDMLHNDPVTTSTVLPSSFPIVQGNQDGGEIFNIVPKSAMSLLGVGTFIALCFGIAKAVEWAYDRLSLRDADSEMSERTKQLLLSRISTFAFSKKIKLDGMDAKKREEVLFKKYIEKWRFKVAMTKRMKRRNEQAAIEEEKRKQQEKGPLGFLRKLCFKSKNKPEHHTPGSRRESLARRLSVAPTVISVSELPVGDSKPPTDRSRPTTASSGTQTRRSAIKTAVKALGNSPAKSSMKQPGSSASSPTKSPKRVTLVAYRDQDSPRQTKEAKDEEFLSIEITHTPGIPTKSALKNSNNSHIQIHSSVEKNHSSPVKVSTDEKPLIKDSSASASAHAPKNVTKTAEDAVSTVSLEEFDFESTEITHKHGDSAGDTAIEMDSNNSKNTDEVSVNMEKYIRPPTRDNPRGVSRPITAGGRESKRAGGRPNTAGQKKSSVGPSGTTGISRRSTKS